MRCKRCKGNLVTIETKNIVYKKCDQCLGILLDMKDFKAIIDLYREIEKKDLKRAESEARHHNEDEADGYLTTIDCGHCDTPMENYEYMYTSKIRIDNCPDCQYLWVDNGKLKRLFNFINKIDKYDKDISSLLPQMLEIKSEVNETFKKIDKDTKAIFRTTKK